MRKGSKDQFIKDIREKGRRETDHFRAKKKGKKKEKKEGGG